MIEGKCVKCGEKYYGWALQVDQRRCSKVVFTPTTKKVCGGKVVVERKDGRKRDERTL